MEILLPQILEDAQPRGHTSALRISLPSLAKKSLQDALGFACLDAGNNLAAVIGSRIGNYGV
jgi:hypothetical protein